MATANVRAVITAEDRASSVIAGVGNKITALAGIAVGGLGFQRLTQAVNESVTASNKLENALIGLGSVASAFGHNADTATAAAKSLAADGLMGINDAATSLKNLLASGFSLDQAITLVERFKDTAAFGRQSALGFGEAIASASEGIKNGNSILVDNAGLTKNLSVILTEAGFSAQDLMKATTNASVRQALFNGLVRESAPQLGDAARMSGTFSGAQARLATAANLTAARLGDVVKGGIAPLVHSASSFISAHQSMIVSVIAAGMAVAGFVAVLVGGAGLVAAALMVVGVLGGPLTIILMAVAALLGTIVFGAVQDLQKQMGKTTQSFATGARSIRNSAQDGMGKAGQEAQKLAERLADIDEQMVKTSRDFRESLAQIITDHKGKVEDLKKQLADENKEFLAAQGDKTADFKLANQDMIREHERKVADITAQIKQEQIAGTTADQTKLNSLQLRLAQENEDFARHTALNQVKYQEDTAKAVAAHEEKKSDLQKKLDEETAFLVKHNADIGSIRDVQLLDEIDKLKRSHTEQMSEFDKQKNRAIKSAQDTTTGMAGAFNGLPGQVNAGLMDETGKKIGEGMGKALKTAFKNSFNNFVGELERFLAPLGETILKVLDAGRAANKNLALPRFAAGHNASGTDNWRGGVTWVGEEGPELVSLPRGSQVLSNSDSKAMASSQSTVINISPQIGVYAGTETEKRKLAHELFESLRDVAGARNMTVAELLA